LREVVERSRVGAGEGIIMGKTTIEWTTRILDGKVYPGYTFNGWIGCTEYDEGCVNCYARTMAKRVGTNWDNVQWGNGQPRYRTQNWDAPLAWNRRAIKENVWRFVFSNSMSDLFDPAVSLGWKREFFELVEKCQSLRWLLLTKRSDLVLSTITEATGLEPGTFFGRNPHVMIGHSIASQKAMDRRLPHIREQQRNGARIFYSAEPLTEQVNFYLDTNPIAWLILGGESGGKSRPCHVDWLTSGLKQGQDAGVPVLIKQLGSKPIGATSTGKGGDFDALPKVLQVREYPRLRA
jgi:protein gp37